MLTGHRVLLRTPEPKDIDLLYAWENDRDVLRVTPSEQPVSREQLKAFVHSRHDIHLQRQLRLMICATVDLLPIGSVDLFEFDAERKCAGVGIMIAREHRKKGYATEALSLVSRYVFDTLGLEELFANIGAQNVASRALFARAGFTETAELYGLSFGVDEISEIIGHKLVVD